MDHVKKSYPMSEKLGRMVREARAKKKVGLKYVSLLMGYKYTTFISQIEFGRKVVPLNRIQELSDILEIPFIELKAAVIDAKIERQSRK